MICATQMLESMVKKPRPTRAEASDVANAVLDGADCVMLSGETAKGDYPLQCIRTMAALAREAEACVWNQRVLEDHLRDLKGMKLGEADGVALSAVQGSTAVDSAAIVALVNTGAMVKKVAKFRPMCPILAVTSNAKLARQMQIHRGIVPVLHDGNLVNKIKIQSINLHI